MNFKSKKHKTKKSKYITLVVVPDATQTVKSLQIPRWIRYPILLGALTITIGVTASTYYISTYISTMEEKIQGFESQITSFTQEVTTKNETIQNLQKENIEYFDLLNKLQIQTNELQNKFTVLEESKDQIIDKLYDSPSQPNRTENQHPSPSVEIKTGAPLVQMENFSAIDADSFQSQVEDLKKNIEKATAQVQKEITSFENLGAEVDELLPYLEAYPSIFPVNGRITSPMGWRRDPFSRWRREYHTGVDLSSSSGTKVKATGKGTVIFAGYNRSYGNLVIIDHGYGITTRYAHNSVLLVKKGDTVNRGDIIAKSGSTGRSTGPHVHYEVRLNDVPQNPTKYLRNAE